MIEIPDITHGIVNFVEVEPGIIYRGGQPFGEGWEHLQGLGVNRVIKLNGREGSDFEAQRLGMEVLECPIPLLEQVLTEPDLQTLRTAVAFIQPGTFVHCTHGQDRTGLVIGLWRISQGWMKKQARAEMKARGFHSALVGLLKGWSDLSDEMVLTSQRMTDNGHA